MTRNKLTDAMAAVDSGGSPFVGDGSADFSVPLDEPIEPSVGRRMRFVDHAAPGKDHSAEMTGRLNGQGDFVIDSFSAIPATDHDALEAQLTSELAAETFAPIDKLSATVAERKTTHGDYVDHARVTQSLKKVIALELNEREYRGQPPLTDRQRESIDMIMHKIGRAVAGESGFADHWLDIQGYAKIAIDE